MDKPLWGLRVQAPFDARVQRVQKVQRVVVAAPPQVKVVAPFGRIFSAPFRGRSQGLFTGHLPAVC